MRTEQTSVGIVDQSEAGNTYARAVDAVKVPPLSVDPDLAASATTQNVRQTVALADDFKSANSSSVRPDGAVFTFGEGDELLRQIAEDIRAIRFVLETTLGS